MTSKKEERESEDLDDIDSLDIPLPPVEKSSRQLGEDEIDLFGAFCVRDSLVCVCCVVCNAGRPTVYHYPMSRSSRGAVTLLEAACSRPPRIIDIVSEPLSVADVERLMAALSITDPRDFMRTNDPLYRELGLYDHVLSREKLIEYIIKYPRCDAPTFN